MKSRPRDFEIGGDFRIGGFEKFAGVRRSRIGELAAPVERLDHRQVVLERRLIVVFAVRRRHVDNAGAVGRGDEVARDDVPRFLIDREEAEPGFVFFSDQIAALHRCDTNSGSSGMTDRRLLCKDQQFIFVFDLDVLDIRIDGETNVGNERPWRRRPHEKVGVVLAFDFRL